MKLSSRNIESQHLSHLGIVAGVIKKIGLISKIDSILPKRSNNKKVSHGQSAGAMILNGLGFTERRLYLVADFFKNKPVDKYLGKNIISDDLNDDTLGRTLDEIYKYGTTKLFSEVAFKIGKEFSFLGKSAHLDTSTLSVEGKYDENETEMKITHGYSKDHRHDLKQVTLSLTTTGPSGFPIWIEGLSGNSSDKTSFHKTIESVKAFQKDLKKSEPFYWVADSALYSKKKLLEHGDSVLWLTRVPESIASAKALVEGENLNWTSINDQYKFVELGSTYGNIRQRWIVIESEQAKYRELKTFNRLLEKQEREIVKLVKVKSKERFYSNEEIEKEIKKIKSKYKNYSFENISTKYNSQKKKYYKVSITFEKNKSRIEKVKRSKGRFILSTNNIDYKLSASELLSEYKDQSKTERGFRFLKDDSFLISDVYLKKPERIQALLLIMCLSLMVYNVGEYILRKKMIEEKESIKNIIGKEVFRPTLKMIFWLMRAVDLVKITIKNKIEYIVTNLTENHEKILRLLGPEFTEMYIF